MDTITVICTVLGGISAIYAIITYYRQFASKDKELKEAITIKFKTNQALAIEIRDSLLAYITSTNTPDALFVQGYTFQRYLKFLEETLAVSLSDQLLQKVRKERLPEAILQSMSQSLDDQFKNLSMVKNYISLSL